jgi:hypothetical protein
MALPKWDIEIKAVSHVQDSVGQAWRNDGNMVELQHFLAPPATVINQWFHPLHAISAWKLLTPATTSRLRFTRVERHGVSDTPGI